MNTYIACGIISIPIYLFYNFICLKKKYISIWIKGSSFSDKNFDVLNDKYYEFQYKCSTNACVLLSLIIIVGIMFKWQLLFFLGISIIISYFDFYNKMFST